MTQHWQSFFQYVFLYFSDHFALYSIQTTVQNRHGHIFKIPPDLVYDFMCFVDSGGVAPAPLQNPPIYAGGGSHSPRTPPPPPTFQVGLWPPYYLVIQ